MEKYRLKEMEDPSQEDIISLVNSIFQVSDYNKTEFSLEFKIEDMDFKSKFEGLARKLGAFVSISSDLLQNHRRRRQLRMGQWYRIRPSL